MAAAASPAMGLDDVGSDADRLPAATTIGRLTWSSSPALTRLEFHGADIERPLVAVASARVLRLDFTAADAATIPSKLEVGSNEVLTVLRVPPLPGVLPANVSARFLVVLAQEGLSWVTEASRDDFTLFIGDAGKVGSGGLSLGGSSYYEQASAQVAAMVAAAGGGSERPAAGEVLPRSVAFVLPAEQAIRASPSAVSAEIGWARTGETKLADARREDWVHLVGGGWIRLPQASDSPGITAIARVATPPRGRTPAAWSVVTLGTGLQADIEELLPGHPTHESLARLFSDGVRLASLTIRVQGGDFAFQLPPKKGRVRVTLSGGQEVESLDPRDLALVDERARPRVDEIFAAPSLAVGDAWETVLVFPGDLDFLAIEKIRLDVGGMSHGLFRVPGSGDRPDE